MLGRLERRPSRGFSLRLPKSYAFATPIILKENNASSFQSLAKRGFVRECNWNFPINDFCSPDATPTLEAVARSRAVQRSKARAARI